MQTNMVGSRLISLMVGGGNEYAMATNPMTTGGWREAYCVSIMRVRKLPVM